MRWRKEITTRQFLILGSCLIVGIIGLVGFYWWYGLFDLNTDSAGVGDAALQPTPCITVTSDGAASLPAFTTPASLPTQMETAVPAIPASVQEPTGLLTQAPSPVTLTGARSGHIYHVSANGSDAYPGTEQQPWRSVQKAANTAVVGDTVIVHEGSYTEVVEFQTSGVERTGTAAVRLTEGNVASFPGSLSDVLPGDSLYIYYSRCSNNGVYPIVEVGREYIRVAGTPFAEETQFVQASIATPVKFQAAAGETVALDPRYQDNRGSPARFIDVSYVILDGFRVTGSQHAGVSFDQSHHNVFQNGEVFGNWRPGVYAVNGSTYNMIKGNSIHDNGLKGPGEGVYVGKSEQDGGPDSAHATHIISNHVYNITEDEGADIKPGIQNTVIANNVYENCASTWGVVIIGKQSSGSLVYGNTFHGNSGSPSWAGAITVHGPNNLVFNNLIFNNAGLDGIYLFKYPGNKVYHNTIVGHDVGIGFDNEGSDLSGTEVSNNLLSQNQSQMVGNTANTILDCNLIDGASSLLGTNPIQAAPLFVNPISGDFRLADGSPALDRCPDRGIHFDLNRLTRPQGALFDAGAIELAHDD